MLNNIRTRLHSLMTSVTRKLTPEPSSIASSLPFYASHPLYTASRVAARTPQALRRRSKTCCCGILAALFFAICLIAERFGPLLSTDKSRWFYDIPNGVDIYACIPGDEWSPVNVLSASGLPHSRMTTVNITLASGLALISRGQLSGGEVVYVTSPVQEMDTATIHIQTWFQRHDLMSLVKICATTREDQPVRSGFGLFTPTWHWLGPIRLEDRMKFTTTVVLPRRTKASPLKIRGLFADLPNTSVKMHDLAGISFDGAHLSSTNSALEVGYLQSSQGVYLSTTNGAIRGKFDAISSLSIQTTSSEIDIDAGLYHDGTYTASKLDVQTRNGKIRAAIDLYSLSAGGRFEVNTMTSLAESSVHIRTAPLGSTLRVQSQTCNAPAELTLPPTYEGLFAAANTDWSDIRINLNENSPGGRWPRRFVLYPDLEDSRGHVKSGKIGSDTGYAMLSTTGGLATLNV